MAKSLFDHIKAITNEQNPKYFDTLEEADMKSWSNYMVNRFLSMKMEWIELVNELQKYNLQPKELYKLYTNILPKGKQWLKYIKGENKMTELETLRKMLSDGYKEIRKSKKYFSYMLGNASCGCSSWWSC